MNKRFFEGPYLKFRGTTKDFGRAKCHSAKTRFARAMFHSLKAITFRVAQVLVWVQVISQSRICLEFFSLLLVSVLQEKTRPFHNCHIWDFISDIDTFCLHIQAKLQFLLLPFLYFQIFQCFTLVVCRSNLIKFIWQWQYLCSWSEQMFYCFASCIHVIRHTQRSYQNWSRGNLVFAFRSKFLPEGGFPPKADHS